MYSFRRARASAGTAGFTMVELMVGMVLAGIFATIVFQLLQGQSRFTQMQGARQEAQQNVRGALELIASELRAIPTGGLEVAETNRVRYYLPRAFGVSCVTAPGTVDAVFPVLPGGTVPTGDVSPARFGMLAFDAGAARWNSSPDPATRSTVTKVEVVGTSDPCPASDVAGQVTVYRFTGTDLPAAPVGTRVALFELVQYDVGESTGVAVAADALWVQRGTGAAGSQQPLAGPLPAATSLEFRFHDRTTGAALPAPVVNPAAIGRVVVRLTTRSRRRAAASTDGAQLTDSVSIFLRN